MTEFVILSRPDIFTLCEDKPVTIYIDKKPYILCTDEYFEKQMRETHPESMDKRVYTSDNGYTGVLYGYSSLSIFDKDGNEVMHTGKRAFDTYEELVKHVEDYPEFRATLDKVFESQKEGK